MGFARNVDLTMKTITRIAAIAIAVFTLSSCLQSSTVIRVKPDGSGAIFARYFFSPQMTAMLGGLAGGLGDLGEGVTVDGPDVDPNKIFKPTKEDLEKDAASYGEGVRYAKHETAKNSEGWEGWLVVYEFDDINKVKFDPNDPPGPLKELENMDPDAAAEAKENISEDSTMSFSMADGVLTVNTGVSKDSVGKIAESGGADDMLGPDGKIPPEAAAQMQMAAGMMQGARMGVFLRADGSIAENQCHSRQRDADHPERCRNGQNDGRPEISRIHAEGTGRRR